MWVMETQTFEISSDVFRMSCRKLGQERCSLDLGPSTQYKMWARGVASLGNHCAKCPPVLAVFVGYAYKRSKILIPYILNNCVYKSTYIFKPLNTVKIKEGVMFAFHIWNLIQ